MGRESWTGWLHRHQRKAVSEGISRAAEAEQQETGHLVLATKRSAVTDIGSGPFLWRMELGTQLQETEECRREKNRVHMPFSFSLNFSFWNFPNIHNSRKESRCTCAASFTSSNGQHVTPVSLSDGCFVQSMF